MWWIFSNTLKKQGESVLTPKMKRRIKNVLSSEKPTVHIGKEGITEQVINEVSKQLDAREMIKAKLLKTALQDEEAKDLAAIIAEKTESDLVEVRGHTFLLFKRKKKR
jgi:RNA-binding protein